MMTPKTAENVFGPYIGMNLRAINVEENGHRVELWFEDPDDHRQVHLLTFWHEAAGIGTGYNHGGWMGNPRQLVALLAAQDKAAPNRFIATRAAVE